RVRISQVVETTQRTETRETHSLFEAGNLVCSPPLREATHDSVGLGLLLRSMALYGSAGWYTRAQAARVLATVDANGVVRDLLRLFFGRMGRTMTGVPATSHRY
ncbi:MAG TPA: hypothetical protein VES20_16015, partial [Bryobacteraceae bacterium]|nr:hypothetical protein [Bryobacteraceae bacterium]